MTTQTLTSIETPCLLLDRGRLQINADRVLRRADNYDVLLRPHLKTSKSTEVAHVLTAGRMSSITVSTLKEAAYFAADGYSDILYAVGITPNKFDHIGRIQVDTGQTILLTLDSLNVARAAVAYAQEFDIAFEFLIEIDCGEHRGGLSCNDAELIEIARVLDASPCVSVRGVMTHAGHSYTTNNLDRILQIAEDERRAAVSAARTLENCGVRCDIVSAGSTPTILYANSFEGLTEIRCGVYAFYDLAQYSRGICKFDEIALSVLATVIGHNRRANLLTIDAGAFALSKDVSANSFRPDVNYGYVCDVQTTERLGNLSVSGVHQEHGSIEISDEAWFERLPIGSMVRVLPNHACPTASAHDHYVVVDGQIIVARWPRIYGW